jgi:hypothetical protein
VLLEQLGGVHLERRASFRSVIMRDSISSRSILATVAVVALADNVMRASRELIGWSKGLTERAGEDNDGRRVRIANELDLGIEI